MSSFVAVTGFVPARTLLWDLSLGPVPQPQRLHGGI
jgi:hypothetical protein